MLTKRSTIYFNFEYFVSNATSLDKRWKVLHQREIKLLRSCDVDLCTIYHARWKKKYVAGLLNKYVYTNIIYINALDDSYIQIYLQNT